MVSIFSCWGCTVGPGSKRLQIPKLMHTFGRLVQLRGEGVDYR